MKKYTIGIAFAIVLGYGAQALAHNGISHEGVPHAQAMASMSPGIHALHLALLFGGIIAGAYVGICEKIKEQQLKKREQRSVQ